MMVWLGCNNNNNNNAVRLSNLLIKIDALDRIYSLLFFKPIVNAGLKLMGSSR